MPQLLQKLDGGGGGSITVFVVSDFKIKDKVIKIVYKHIIVWYWPVFNPILILLWFLSDVTFWFLAGIHWRYGFILQINILRSQQVHQSLQDYHQIFDTLFTNNIKVLFQSMPATLYNKEYCHSIGQLHQWMHHYHKLFYMLFINDIKVLFRCPQTLPYENYNLLVSYTKCTTTLS